MALRDDEVQRIKAELGFNVMDVGAEPYISFVAIFPQVIQPYINAGAATTSSSSVTVTDPLPNLKTLTLASATGFEAGARIWVDIDDWQEFVTVRSISGATITCLLSKPHSGTYPVTVDGGEGVVRECLKRIAEIKAEMSTVLGEGPVKKVDEVEFYNAGGSLFGGLGLQLQFWRDQLASALGLENMWRRDQCVSQVAVY